MSNRKPWMLVAMVILCLGSQPQFVCAQTSQRDAGEKEKKDSEEREKARQKKEADAKSLRAKVAEQLKFEIVLPKSAVSAKRVSSTRFKCDIKITNPTEFPALVAPFFQIKVVDAEGTELKPPTRRPRYGPIMTKEKKDHVCRLEAVKFILVPAESSRLIPVSLWLYDYDPLYHVGYKFVEPGTYDLEFTHVFAKDKFLKLCVLEDCENHGDELKPWNRACELTRKFAGKLKVVE